MTNQQILEKAIQKAIDGGWGEPDLDPKLITADCFRLGGWHLNQIIFDKDFAKALFGEEPYYRFDGDTLDTPKKWQYHLQQMVIADDPIKYLGENI